MDNELRFQRFRYRKRASRVRILMACARQALNNPTPMTDYPSLERHEIINSSHNGIF